VTAALFLFVSVARSQSSERVLHIYGPGGPLGPLNECADRFARAKGVSVFVVAGPEAEWIARAEKDADLIFGGAEYMLTQFDQKHPGFLDATTRTELYRRAAGILVRKGNPKKIRSLADLTKASVRIVDANGAGQLGLWEDMAGRHGLIEGIQKNIAVSVASSAEAIAKFKSLPEIDAWITYESWHYRLKELTDLVRVPEKERLYRGTPIALTKRTTQQSLAREFIRFLKTDEAHRVFQRWGWD